MFIEPDKLAEASKEQLVEARLKALGALDELKGEIEAIDAELLDNKLPMDEQVICGYVVKKIKRTTFDIDLEGAKAIGAIKIVPEKITPATEAIDTPKLHKLLKAGIDIPRKTTVKIEMLQAEQPEA